MLTTAPTANCRPNPEAGTAWSCDEKVGGAPVVVSYLADEGLYVSVLVRAKGFTDCQILFDTLEAAWQATFTKRSEYDRGPLADGYWNLAQYKTQTSAAWSYNQFSGACTATTINAKLNEVVDAAKKKRAAAAAAEL